MPKFSMPKTLKAVKEANPDILQVIMSAKNLNQSEADNLLYKIVRGSLVGFKTTGSFYEGNWKVTYNPYYRGGGTVSQEAFSMDLFNSYMKPFYDAANRRTEWRKQSKIGMGRRSTILTSGQGVKEEPTLALSGLKKKLGA